jgi:uncharacterized protein (TIGR00290 family)
MQSADNAVVLWTGGKDSCLALHRAHDQGLRVTHLVTLGPKDPQFLAHPIAVMKLQAEALGLPHVLLEVREPYAHGYPAALIEMKELCAATHVITGDIDDVAGHPSALADQCIAAGLELVRPLWNASRRAVLDELQECGFRVIFSCVKTPPFDETWIGRVLDAAAMAQLEQLHRTEGVDLCGENGEYHTLVLDAPLFTHRLAVPYVSRKKEDLAYLEVSDTAVRKR